MEPTNPNPPIPSPTTTTTTNNDKPSSSPLHRIIFRSTPFLIIGSGIGWLITPSPFVYTKSNMLAVGTNTFLVALACFSTREVLDWMNKQGRILQQFNHRSTNNILATSSGAIGGFGCGFMFGGLRTGIRVAIPVSFIGLSIQECSRFMPILQK
jgi:hypothetical protein